VIGLIAIRAATATVVLLSGPKLDIIPQKIMLIKIFS
jgi:hypothetical protein